MRFGSDREELIYRTLRRMANRLGTMSPPPSLKEITGALGVSISVSALSKAISSLEERGYVQRIWRVK